MRAPWKRAAVIALATCSMPALTLLTGCKTDVQKANETVSEEVEKASFELATPSPKAAHDRLNTLIGKSKGAAPESQILAEIFAAQADLDAADLLLAGPGATFDEIQA